MHYIQQSSLFGVIISLPGLYFLQNSCRFCLCLGFNLAVFCRLVTHNKGKDFLQNIGQNYAELCQLWTKIFSGQSNVVLYIHAYKAIAIYQDQCILTLSPLTCYVYMHTIKYPIYDICVQYMYGVNRIFSIVAEGCRRTPKSQLIQMEIVQKVCTSMPPCSLCLKK